MSHKFPKRRDELEKKSFLNKAMKNVKSKALKALNEFKDKKGNGKTIIAKCLELFQIFITYVTFLQKL